VAVLRAVGRSEATPTELLTSAFFTRNLVEGSRTTGHYWSLAVEEQFYLVWPLLLVTLRQSRRRSIVTAALILVAPLWHHANVKMFGATNVNWLRADLRYESLLAGALLALLRHEAGPRLLLDRASSVGSAACAIVAAALLAALTQEHRFPGSGQLVLDLFEVGCVTAILQLVLSRRAPLAERVLSLPPLVWLGRVSYSLYLWQQPSFYGFRAGGADAFPWNVVTALARGTLAFFLVEKPTDRIRARFQRSAPDPPGVLPSRP